jgi:hypothetical protein
MRRVKGIYDGEHVRLVEPLEVPPETEVEVLVPEPSPSDEDEYWRRLREAGLVLKRPEPTTEERNFTPIQIEGEPLSQTIIDNRR